MKRPSSSSGIAALEMALIAPLLVSVIIVAVDFGAALLSKARITRALESSAEYATLAGQNSIAWSTIKTNAMAIASSVTSPFLGTAIVDAHINQDLAAGSKCCPNSSGLNCGATTTSCTDGSTPGSYIKITVRYPFNALFSTDTYLTGTTLSDSIVAPIQ